MTGATSLRTFRARRDLRPADTTRQPLEGPAMTAIAAALIAIGLLLGVAATLFALATRGTADAEDRNYTRWLAGVAQACTGLALVILVRYGYHPADAARDCVYAAMAAAALAFTARLPERSGA